MKATKDIPKVKLNIKVSRQITPKMRRSGTLFWQKLIRQVREELQAESEGKGDR